MLTQQCQGNRNFSLAIQRSIENSSLRRGLTEVQSNSKMSRLPKPIADAYSSRPHAMKAFNLGDKDCEPNSGYKITRKTGIPVLTSLRGLNVKEAGNVRDLAEISLDDVELKVHKLEDPDSEPIINLNRKACTEFISDVEQILSHTLLKGVAFGTMLESSRKKPVALEDELSDIIEDLGDPTKIIADVPSPPKDSEPPAPPPSVLQKKEQDLSVKKAADREFVNMIQPAAFCGLVHRRNSEEKSSRQSSRSRSYRQSRSRRSRRSRRQYVIPGNGCYKCSSTAICDQPKPSPDVYASLKPASNPALDFQMLKGTFNFGTEELEKLSSVFIQRSDRLCSQLCNFFQDTFPSFSQQQNFDIFRDEISLPTFTVRKTRNRFSCWFADCEDLKFAITQNEIPKRHGIPTTSILVECKECPATDCPYHTANVYICNGTMQMGTCEHLSCNKLDPVILLKNILMKETMVIRTRSLISGSEDADFLVYKLDEDSNDPFDEQRDGPLIGHIARRFPKEVSPGTFNRTPIIFPEYERLSIIFHDKLNAFSKGIILSAALLLKHEVLN